MAEYKGIKGFKVQYLSADPSDPIIGQTWYNSTSKDLKYTSVTTGAWASGGSVPAARTESASAGSQTAGLIFGSSTAPTNTSSDEYNGSTWTAGGTLNNGNQEMAGFGIQTAAVMAGGQNIAGTSLYDFTEEYDGSSWSASGTLPATTKSFRGAGTQTAGLGYGGGTTPSNYVNTSQEYNGATWSAGNPLTTPLRVAGGVGIQTAALAVGGTSPASSPIYLTLTQEYDGISWTNGGNLPEGRGDNATSQLGTQTAAISSGGVPVPATTNSNFYDGTSWTAISPMTTARLRATGAGTASLTLVMLGDPTNTAVEEYTGPGIPQTKAITVS